MFHLTTRPLLLFAVSLALLGAALGALVLAAPGGNTTASAVCEHGGYLDYTDADRNAFTDERQCADYAAHGGTLRRAPVAAALSIVYVQSSAFGGSVTFTGAGLLSGSGVTRDSTLMVGFPVLDARMGTADVNGAFSAQAGFWCGALTDITVHGLAADGTPVRASEAPPC